jgi:hypothetical protein
MPIAPSDPPLAPALRLTADHVSAVLDACGYSCNPGLLASTAQLAAGCRVLVQFGDLIATNADGVTCLTIRCSIVINGGEDSGSGVRSWQIRKVLPAPIGPIRLCIVIEADLLLGSGVLIDELLPHSGAIYQHLRLLIADMRATLHELPVHDAAAHDVDPPVLRIEASFLGDLATGRSGIASSRAAGARERSAAIARVTHRHRHITTAACDCLLNGVLPELAQIIPGTDPHPSPHCAAPQPTATEQSLASSSQPLATTRAQSIDLASHAATPPAEPLQPSTCIH